MSKPYFQDQEGDTPPPYRYRNGNGVVTWRIVATGAVLALAAVLWWQMQSISTRVDNLTYQVGLLKGEVEKKLDP